MPELSVQTGTNIAEYSVSEISTALKRTVEETYGQVRVRGEISGFRGPHSSGHAYFALKDERARIEAVVWRGVFSRLKFLPEEGLEVIATGKLTTYPGSSKYQIVIESLEPAGAGALMALLEERRKRLAAEGLFDPNRKRLLPYMPRVIGVITSPTGAVIRDIIHRIKDRFALHVLVWPVRVQGENSGAEVAAAIAGFNALTADSSVVRPDVLIVARGGGSLEDLWGFNDEALVRAVADSQIPVISAVGHETDWTLIDHVADMRAPTPTGAAELAVPVRVDLEAQLASLAARLAGAMTRLTERRWRALKSAERSLPGMDSLLALPRRRFDEAALRLGQALRTNTEKKRTQYIGVRLSSAPISRQIDRNRKTVLTWSRQIDNASMVLLRHRRERLVSRRLPVPVLQRRIQSADQKLETLQRRWEHTVAFHFQKLHQRMSHCERLLNTLSYEAVLERGFAVVRDLEQNPLSRARQITPGMVLELQLADGRVTTVAGTTSRMQRRTSGQKKPGRENQGNLF